MNLIFVLGVLRVLILNGVVLDKLLFWAIVSSLD